MRKRDWVFRVRPFRKESQGRFGGSLAITRVEELLGFDPAQRNGAATKAKTKETPQVDSDEHRFYRSSRQKNGGTRLYREDAETAEKRRDVRKDGES